MAITAKGMTIREAKSEMGIEGITIKVMDLQPTSTLATTSAGVIVLSHYGFAPFNVLPRFTQPIVNNSNAALPVRRLFGVLAEVVNAALRCTEHIAFIFGPLQRTLEIMTTVCASKRPSTALPSPILRALRRAGEVVAIPRTETPTAFSQFSRDGFKQLPTLFAGAVDARSFIHAVTGMRAEPLGLGWPARKWRAAIVA